MNIDFSANVILTNVLLHLMQEYDFLPVWILSCIFISPLILNVLIKRHIWTMQMSSLLCGSFRVPTGQYLVCVSCHILNQWVTNEFSPVWILSCLIENGFSALCILSWVFKLSLYAKALSHQAVKLSFSCVSFHVSPNCRSLWMPHQNLSN